MNEAVRGVIIRKVVVVGTVMLAVSGAATIGVGPAAAASRATYINCWPEGSPSHGFRPRQHPRSCDIWGEPEDEAHLVIFRRAHWSHWGDTSTTATGVILNNHPGQPGAVPSWKGGVRLFRIRRGCGGRRYYTRATISIPGTARWTLRITPTCKEIPLTP